MIVFPMAGLSRRFSEAGYTQPKYMLDLHGRTLFAHAVGGFARYFHAEPFLFIARGDASVREFIRGQLQLLGAASAEIVLLENPTAGQADTVKLGLEQAAVPHETPITIFNIDTFRPGFTYPDKRWMQTADGYLEVMHSTDPGFSFVLAGEGGEERVAATAEKKVISSLGSTGLYWFRRSGDFLSAMSVDETQLNGQELYVAPLYNDLIAKGRDIRYYEVEPSEVIICGTPTEYTALLKNSAPALKLT